MLFVFEFCCNSLSSYHASLAYTHGIKNNLAILATYWSGTSATYWSGTSAMLTSEVNGPIAHRSTQ